MANLLLYEYDDVPLIVIVSDISDINKKKKDLSINWYHNITLLSG